MPRESQESRMVHNTRGQWKRVSKRKSSEWPSRTIDDMTVGLYLDAVEAAKIREVEENGEALIALFLKEVQDMDALLTRMEEAKVAEIKAKYGK